MPNRLAGETSPYLLQHRENPVDWYPWGPEALERARELDRPIFLSIGYSACHWCHVMEHESFENPQIAEKLNNHFVSIKVDREERPDLDAIYMSAVQMMSGRGGWPMSVFLTPQLQPFYGGTYWPPEPRVGMPGFGQVLDGIADAWQERRDQIAEQADKLTRFIQAEHAVEGEAGTLEPALLKAAEASLERIFDHRHGGFGSAPKFPHPMDLQLLLRCWRRDRRDALLEMVTKTLDHMAAGGMYDHLGGGFCRYSVDERWLVPHFEKMLYDNAMLARCYVEGYQATASAEYARVARETLDYVLREMTGPEGGFYSSQDADSEGVEGKFYVWDRDEVEAELGTDAAETFCYVYDVSPLGNFRQFPGKNILNLPKTISQCAALREHDEAELREELAAARKKLLASRSRRVPPGTDDKVLVGWNALMIDALAFAAGALGEPRYLQAATAAADFVLGQMRREDGRLLHTWRGGRAHLDAYLDDYACLINALVTLYEAGLDEQYIDEAVRLADLMQRHFADPDGGGYFYTADDHEELIARQKDVQDNPTPSGNAMAATALLRLGKLTGRSDYLDAAVGTLEVFVPFMERFATAAGQMLLAVDFHLGPTPEIVVVGSGKSAVAEVLADLHRRFIPNRVLACRAGEAGARRSAALSELFAGKGAEGDEPAAYVCQNFTCQAPAVGKAAMLEAWEKLT